MNADQHQNSLAPLASPAHWFEGRWWIETLGVAALCLLGARLGLRLALPGGYVAPLWPPSGLALAILLLRGSRAWPGIWIGIFVAHIWYYFDSPMSVGGKLAISAIFGVSTTLAAGAGAFLVRKVAGPANPLLRVRSVGAFLALGGVAGGAISATVGLTNLCMLGSGDWANYGSMWMTWWLGDMAGVFVVTPLLLAWSGTRPMHPAARWVELTACFGLLFASTYYVFVDTSVEFFLLESLTFLVVPLVVWAALRFEQRGAALALGFIATLTIWAAIHQVDPFTRGSRTQALLLVELFLGVMVLTGLGVAALATERGRAEAAQQRLLAELETRVQDRTAALTLSEAQAREHLAEVERARAALSCFLEDERIAKRALRAAEEKYRSIFEHAVEGIYQSTPEGRYLTVNPAMARLYGYGSPEEMVGEITDIGRQIYADPTERQKLLELLREREGVAMFECRMRRKDGSLIWIRQSSRAVRDRAGRVVFFEGGLEDVTERKQAEAEMQQAFSTLQLFIDTVPSFIAFVDAEERYQLVNRRYEEWFSLSQEQILGRPLRELHRPATYAGMEPHIRAVKEGRTVRFDSEMTGRDGKKYWFDLRYIPRHSSEGAWLGHFVLALDVTERHKADVIQETMLTLESRLSAASSPTDAARIIFETADALWDWDAGALDVYSPEDDRVWAVMYLDTFDGERREVPRSRESDEPTPRMRRIMRNGPELTLRTRPFERMDDSLVFGDTSRLSASILCVPIRTQGRSVGVLSVQSYTPDAFVEADLKLLQALADHCGGTLERIRATEAMRKSEFLLRCVLDTNPAIIFVKDRDSRILLANEAMAGFYGLRVEAVIGRRQSDLHAEHGGQPVELAQWLAEDRHIISTGERIEREETGTDGQGERRHFHTFKYPLELDRGLDAVLVITEEVTQRKRAEEALRDSRDQLRRLARRLQTVREEERTGIAREIHDVLAQELTRLKLDLSWIDRRLTHAVDESTRADLQQKVASMMKLADVTIASTQQLATELRPVVLDSLGLGPAIEWQVEDFQNRTGLTCIARVSHALPPLDRGQATALFRIVQESLTNIVRHAGARRVEVTLEPQGVELCLSVLDDGRGITPDELANPKSIGLLGMKERAALLGGETIIAPAPGGGTLVRVTTPLPAAARAERKP